jgi:very-short-patch-repair endonuclease
MIESCTMVDRQQQFARRMRAQPTDAERVLWQRLRHDIALVGSHFRRQARVGPFIVDFATPDLSPQGRGEPRQRAKRAPRLSRKKRN